MILLMPAFCRPVWVGVAAAAAASASAGDTAGTWPAPTLAGAARNPSNGSDWQRGAVQALRGEHATDALRPSPLEVGDELLALLGGHRHAIATGRRRLPQHREPQKGRVAAAALGGRDTARGGLPLSDFLGERLPAPLRGRRPGAGARPRFGSAGGHRDREWGS
jgi:hypothetical protein